MAGTAKVIRSLRCSPAQRSPSSSMMPPSMRWPGTSLNTLTLSTDACGRMIRLTVCTVQETKRKAAQSLRDGDRAQALMAYDEADGKLAAAMSAAPSAELGEEQQIINELRARTDAFDDQYAAKLARSEHSRKSGKRGR